MINEEVTDENIKKILNDIPINLSSVEKLILCNDGTNQTLLSVLFGVPIKVKVISQIDFKGVIVRWVKMVAEYSSGSEITVCLAESVIDTNLSGFRNGIIEKEMGIGQLISSLGLNTKKRILGMYADENIFSRTYQLRTSDYEIDMIITEIFQKEAFKYHCTQKIISCEGTIPDIDWINSKIGVDNK